jgi:hypothetical protein
MANRFRQVLFVVSHFDLIIATALLAIGSFILVPALSLAGDSVPSPAEKSLTSAIQKNFPFADNQWAPSGTIAAGSYAPCFHGEQPVVIFDKLQDKFATDTQNIVTGTLKGKFILLECGKSSIPGAISEWSNESGLVFDKANRSVATGMNASVFESQPPNVMVLNSIITRVKHEENFEAGFTLTPDIKTGTAQFDIKSIQAYSPSGSVYVGKQAGGNAVVYGIEVPNKISIDR